VNKNIYAAIGLLYQAADHGYGYAQYQLGNMYFNGSGVVKNPVDANNWWFKAAENGVAEAQENIAITYIKGELVAKDMGQAYMWWALAAEHGRKKSKKNIGIISKKMSDSQIAAAKQLVADWHAGHKK